MDRGELYLRLEALNHYCIRMSAHFQRLVTCTHFYPYISHVQIRRDALRAYHKAKAYELIKHDRFINEYI